MNTARKPPRPTPPMRRRRQSGITLIEVMVGVLLFSFGLLGLVALQARATQYSVDAEDSNRAALLASDIAATMETSRTLELPAGVVTAWSGRVADPAAGGLPNGVGAVTVDAGVATVLVTWKPPGAPEAAPDHRYQTQVVLP